ncbi:ABC transporter ATP-binding protein [Paenibacillus sp. HN-1]|uniref:ABC transporter ATP-binding protein n=1 Tax=Paenibacillus TaxID=44249 RepID=UPI001CA8F180|nr:MULTISPECIES: ABC transporter ATP-binding protein [Paenibacillus]MBY9078527.1 ABC transporter ATP-binding protein [Paenibacillus sp. CGMCC 1.18879]MBY9082820.1 ABC transporter ATP-binding protein [Paenibacillus sinensis]
MNSILKLSNVSWRRGTKLLLDQVSWTIEPGQHWALLGLNGSGKTTLLNMVNGYIWPTEGEVEVLGERFGDVDLRELRKSIGWVSSSLQEKLRGSDKAQAVVISGKHASIGLYVNVPEEDYERARELMVKLGCEHLWDREFRNCSQGEKQKVLIGRALMAEPRILILDEPCNGLDLFARERLLKSIEELAHDNAGPTLIYVTHHTEEILPAFSHTILLRKGQVFDSGETGEMLNTERLSRFFEGPVRVQTSGDRTYIFAQNEPASKGE